MTLVQNRRQLLSGSNSLLLVWCLFCCSCSITKPVPSQEAGVPREKPPAESPKTEVAKEIPVNQVKETGKKDEYTIAMLLPFQSSKVFITDLNETSTYYFPEESQLAVEYYQGAMIALDSLQQNGLKTRLQLHDVGMDTLQLKLTLLKSELKKSDLIIGPVSNSSLKITCEYSKENKINLVSPFSATAICSFPNPYYILANATMRSHCEKIYDYISRNSYHGEVFMLYKKKTADLELVKYFKEYQALKAKATDHAIKFIELTDSTEKKYNHIKELLSDEHKNIIVVPSNDEAFVRTVIRQLNGFAESYAMEIFGMPTWINFDHIPYDQLVNTHTHITQNYWIDKGAPAAITFKEAYFKKYKVNPTDYAVRGYDQMMYFGSLLLRNGTQFEESFKKHSGSELAERFTMEAIPLANDDKNIWFYENKSVYMLRYDGDTVVKVPD